MADLQLLHHVNFLFIFLCFHFVQFLHEILCHKISIAFSTDFVGDGLCCESIQFTVRNRLDLTVPFSTWCIPSGLSMFGAHWTL